MISYAEFTRQVGLSLRFATIEANVTIVELARRTRLSRFTIGKVFKGRPTNLRTIYIICKALKVTPGICITGVCTEPLKDEPGT